MSSGAKRLVQSLRGRTGGRGTGGGRSDAGAGEDSGVGGGGASTSATRLCHYDSGHELDEISVIGATVRDNEGLTTPTTPCHCRNIKYGSGQTLCSITGLPPAPAIPAHRGQSVVFVSLSSSMTSTILDCMSTETADNESTLIRWAHTQRSETR